jgi:rod shape-determining protein MreC
MRLSPKLKIGVAIILLIAILLVLNLTSADKEVKNFFYLISLPIQKTLWQIGDNLSDFFEAISETKNLKKENETLKLKNQELLSQIVSLKEVEKENEILRTALNLGLEKNFQLELARIISKDISQDAILIDKGFEDGLSKNLPVITPEKALLGKIGEVYKNFSRVNLISHKESTLSAKIEGKDIEGLIKGKGGLSLAFELIPKEKEIKEGDLIITTQLGGIFPEGLLIGEIKEVKKSDIEPFQTAEIEPKFNLEELKTLFVVTEF